MNTIRSCRKINSFSKLKAAVVLLRCNVTVSGASSGTTEFSKNFESYHLEISSFQKFLLGFGSAALSLADPRRGDMIAAMGEITGTTSLEYVRERMLESEEGSRILTEKPRITSATIDLNKLAGLKEGTVGKAYYNFMKKYNYSPDARLAVRFVDDVELAYVIQRYREVHDLFHSILNMPTNMLGEVTVKWIEGIQTRLPMCVGGALFGAARLAPKYTRMYSTSSKPQALLDPTVEESLEKEEFKPKKHPGVLRLPCVSVPESIQKTIETILVERNLGDVADKGIQLHNYLASRKPPMESMDLKIKKREMYEHVVGELALNPAATEQYDKEYLDKMTEGSVDQLMRQTTYNWKPLKMDDVMSHYYLLGRAAAEYAVVSRVFNEIKRRDFQFEPKNLFDFGSGVGTVSWVAHGLWAKSLREYFTVDSSPDVNDLALRVLQHNDPSVKPFIQPFFQRQFLPAAPRQYDLVTSAYSLMELPGVKARLNVLNNLWNKTSKYLVLVEQGSFAGFQLLNEARDFIFHISEKSNELCHVFAPCPHDQACPIVALSDNVPCNLTVKYAPLAIRQVPEKAQSRTERFSYLILAKGNRSDSDPAWPRVVREVLLRHHHTVCRLCTSKGKLQEVILTRSKHGKHAYKCSRYSTVGDLLPLKDATDQDDNIQ